MPENPSKMKYGLSFRSNEENLFKDENLSYENLFLLTYRSKCIEDDFFRKMIKFNLFLQKSGAGFQV